MMKKLSARNQLGGNVVEVHKGQTTAHVRIDIGNGVVITSSITNEAVDDLGLAMGDDVVAVIKASDVMVGKRTELCPDRRLLGGHGPQPYLERVTSASRAPGRRQTAARSRRRSSAIAPRSHYRCDIRDWTGQQIGPLYGRPAMALLEKAEPIDEPGKNANLRRTLLITGRDGYTVALAVGEIDPHYEGKQVIVAYSGGDPPASMTFLRLVVPGDVHGGRSVRDIATIELR